MNEKLLSLSSYIDIIHTVGQWKVISAKDLHSKLSNKIAYKTLRNKLNVLEKEDLLKSRFVGNKQKHVYLTNKGIQFTEYDKTYEPSELELTHDLILCQVMNEFLKYSKVFNAILYHQINDYSLNPDGILKLVGKNGEYSVAVELELTQKSKSRVQSKFSKYSKSDKYDFCIYISNKQTLTNTYKRYLGEMGSELNSKVYFIFKSDLSEKETNLEDCVLEELEKTHEFKRIFGEKLSGTFHGTTCTNHLRPQGKT